MEALTHEVRDTGEDVGPIVNYREDFRNDK
jgi:hypothetical protein